MTDCYFYISSGSIYRIHGLCAWEDRSLPWGPASPIYITPHWVWQQYMWLSYIRSRVLLHSEGARVGRCKISRSMPDESWFSVPRPWIRFCVAELRAGAMAVLIFHLHLPAKTSPTGLSNGSAALPMLWRRGISFHFLPGLFADGPYCALQLWKAFGANWADSASSLGCDICIFPVYLQRISSVARGTDISSSLCKHIGPGL